MFVIPKSIYSILVYRYDGRAIFGGVRVSWRRVDYKGVFGVRWLDVVCVFIRHKLCIITRNYRL
jgi:hypothetical protein